MEKNPKSSKSKAHHAFYEPPACVKKTSSEIISEARAAIMLSGVPTSSTNSANIQPVNTKRPYTPRDGQRTLFGRSRGSSQRPPSSFSLRYLQYQDSVDSGDVSLPSGLPPKRSSQLEPMSLGSHNQSAALEIVKGRSSSSFPDFGSISTYENLADNSVLVGNSFTRLPSISRMVDAQDIRRKRRHQFRSSASLDNLPEELEGNENSSKLFTNEVPVRNAYSSPKEHIERLSDCFEGSQKKENSVSKITSRATTSSRKIMKHDNILTNAKSSLGFNLPNDMFENKKVSLAQKNSILSLDVGNLNSNSQGTLDNNIIKSTRSSCSSSDLEQTLFGPNISPTEKLTDHSTTEVDGGVFGEKLQEKNEMTAERYEPDLKSAIYQNRINEAKLANAHKRQFSEDSPSALKVHQILEKLHELAMTGGADSLVIKSLDDLYFTLSETSAHRKGNVSSKLRTQILKCVYKFVERPEDNLLLKLARVIFLFSVTGSNLAGVCKLVFKVARNDKNDHLFLEGNILDLFIDALGSASPLEDAEACVYGYGALKFLTMNNQLLSLILGLGTVDLMVLHLKIVNSARSEGGRLPEQTSHAIFQMTGALRNVAGEETTFPLLVSNGAVSQLCQSMELFSADLDLVTNIARTFSIISTNDDCCEAIVKYKSCIKLFAKLFLKYPGRQDIVVRLGYALGNLLAKSDDIRLELLQEDGAMDTVLDLLQLYLQKDLDLARKETESTALKELTTSLESGSDGSIEDVIVKMVRIIANMSMNMDVGERLTFSHNGFLDGKEQKSTSESFQRCSKIGDRAVGLLLTVLRRKSVAESAELVLSTLSTLNNLTFYPSSEENSIFYTHLMDLSQALYTLLMSNLDECLVEATKVLGNLTRSKSARDFLLETGGLNQLLKFLQTDNHELLRSTTGVFVNLMADADKREAFRLTQGVSRFIALLLYHGESDWLLASLICQVLWNYCIDMKDPSWLGADHTSQLVEVLVDFLDDEHLFGTRDSTHSEEGEVNATGIVIYQQWEEFAVIATNLLEKIESNLEKDQQSGVPQSLAINQLNISQSHPLEKITNQWEEIPPKTDATASY